MGVGYLNYICTQCGSQNWNLQKGEGRPVWYRSPRSVWPKEDRFYSVPISTGERGNQTNAKTTDLMLGRTSEKIFHNPNYFKALSYALHWLTSTQQPFLKCGLHIFQHSLPCQVLHSLSGICNHCELERCLWQKPTMSSKRGVLRIPMQFLSTFLINEAKNPLGRTAT